METESSEKAIAIDWVGEESGLEKDGGSGGQ